MYSIADSICLAFRPLLPANVILLSWEAVQVVFVRLWGFSRTVFVINRAHPLNMWSLSSWPDIQYVDIVGPHSCRWICFMISNSTNMTWQALHSVLHNNPYIYIQQWQQTLLQFPLGNMFHPLAMGPEPIHVFSLSFHSSHSGRNPHTVRRMSRSGRKAFNGVKVN